MFLCAINAVVHQMAIQAAVKPFLLQELTMQMNLLELILKLQQKESQE